MPHNVIDLLASAGHDFPDKVALRRGWRSYTHAEVLKRVMTIASNLQLRGVNPGDRFLFSVYPDTEGILLALGIVAAGGSIMLNNPDTSQRALESRVSLHPPKYAVAESSLYLSSNRVLSKFKNRRQLPMPHYGRLPVQHFFTGKRRVGVPVGAVSTEKLTVPATKVKPVDAYAEAFITFTSDDPAVSETVIHTRASIGSALLAIAALCDIDENSRVYTEHFMVGLAAMISGGEWDIPEYSPTENMRKWISPLYGERASHVFLSPEELTPVAEEVENRSPRPLRIRVLAMNASEESDSIVWRLSATAPHIKVLAAQGLTEVLPYAHTEGAGKIAYTNGDLIGGVILGATARIDSPEANTSEFVLDGDALMLGRLGTL